MECIKLKQDILIENPNGSEAEGKYNRDGIQQARIVEEKHIEKVFFVLDGYIYIYVYSFPPYYSFSRSLVEDRIEIARDRR